MIPWNLNLQILHWGIKLERSLVAVTRALRFPIGRRRGAVQPKRFRRQPDLPLTCIRRYEEDVHDRAATPVQ